MSERKHCVAAFEQDGVVKLLFLAIPCQTKREEERALKAHIKELKENDLLNKDIEVIVFGEEEIPDRRYRNAFSLQDKQIIIDFEKAKGICKEFVRSKRVKPLEALDVFYMKAHEQGDDLQPIIDKKQYLRDLPDLIDKAKTLKQLDKFFEEEVLNG